MRVLIVEDDVAARRGLTELVRAWGYEAEGAADGQEGLERITTYRPSAVLADMVMPRMDGLELLRHVKDQLSDITFVLITAQGSVDTAVVGDERRRLRLPDEAGRSAAPPHCCWDMSPSGRARCAMSPACGISCRSTADSGRWSATPRRSERSIASSSRPRPPRHRCSSTANRAPERSSSRRPFIELSGRSKHPFVAINCAAIPESLLENEIFGHERGAFTGAVERRPGCFELAHTGTLFLDEIAEVSPGIQAKLLRVLQERTVRRLGGQKEQAGRRAADRRDERRPGQGGAAGQASRGPVLPYQRDRHLRAAASRARRGHPAPRADVHRRSSTSATARPCGRPRRMPCACFSATRGRATSASFATSSSAP